MERRGGAPEPKPDTDYRGESTVFYPKLGGFRNLLVWKRADDLADAIHRKTSKLGPGHYRLSDQMRGAAISVPANIAEGYSRESLADYIRFCEIARASLAELGTYLHQCERWGLLTEGERNEVSALFGETSFLLNQLLRALWAKRETGDWNRTTREDPSPYDSGPLPDRDSEGVGAT